MRKSESQKIALCGVLGALSVVLLLLGSALQIGTYAAPMLVSFLQIPVLEEYGGKYALLLYITVSILAVLLVPETELALFYALVMGYYPVLRKAMQRVKSTLLRWIAKFERDGVNHLFDDIVETMAAISTGTLLDYADPVSTDVQ